MLGVDPEVAVEEKPRRSYKEFWNNVLAWVRWEGVCKSCDNDGLEDRYGDGTLEEENDTRHVSLSIRWNLTPRDRFNSGLKRKIWEDRGKPLCML
ncbi:hypothetical protein VNO77_02634 [Canavalia gladiata]|uniref:Uncharacterized protein n=1 Tax=Canavalia gladiata TaxID=3824 RepID=A0AAN9MVE7_CANGL